MNALDKMTPHDRLCLAVSILQAHILASDTKLIPKKMFGVSYMPSASLEACAQILMDMMSEVETLEGRT